MTRTAIQKINGEQIGVFTINEVLTENQENRTQDVYMVPYNLPTGDSSQPFIQVTTTEFLQGYRGVDLQVANDTVNIYIAPALVDQLNMTDAQMDAHLESWSEKLGFLIRRVYENKNPTRTDVEANYDFYDNNFNSGDKVLTNTMANNGSNSTTHEYATINDIYVIYSSNASVGAATRDIFNKELWRCLGFNQTQYGEVSSSNGGYNLNLKETAVGRALATWYTKFAQGKEMTSPETLFTQQ